MGYPVFDSDEFSAPYLNSLKAMEFNRESGLGWVRVVSRGR
jgi:hypothetical protein